MFYCMNNICLVACNPLDTWFTALITIELLHAFLITFGYCMGNTWLLRLFILPLGLLHAFLMSPDTWFIAWVTLDLLHVFLLTLGLLRAFPTSHDTWFVAHVTFGLLHAFILTLDLFHAFLVSHDTWLVPCIHHKS